MTETSRLLHDWFSGGRSALEQLITRHADWIRRRVAARLGPQLRRKTDSVDVVQDAMKQPQAVGHRTDIYSLGATLYELLASSYSEDFEQSGRAKMARI